MSFDPSLPADNSQATAAQMRLQLNALKALIDALSAHVDDIVNGYNTTLNDIVHKEADDFADTSKNSNGVATLGLVVSDPPTQAQVQSLADKMDELVLALRR